MDGRNAGAGIKACAVLAAAWIAASVWSVLPGDLAGKAAANGLASLVLLVFVLVHASLAHGWKGALAFMAIGYLVGLGFEASSVAWGFPFGSFVHNVAAPRLLDIPIYVPIAYPVLGWLAWTMARLIARSDPVAPGGLFVVPLLAALILTGFDYGFDAIGATVQHMWTYRYPGGHFGVPLSNFLGWILTGTVMFQIFALFEPRFAAEPGNAGQGRLYWMLPGVLWAVMALRQGLMVLDAGHGIATAGSRSFVVADVYEAGFISGLLAMLPPAIAALARAAQTGSASGQP